MHLGYDKETYTGTQQEENGGPAGIDGPQQADHARQGSASAAPSTQRDALCDSSVPPSSVGCAYQLAWRRYMPA